MRIIRLTFIVCLGAIVFIFLPVAAMGQQQPTCPPESSGTTFTIDPAQGPAGSMVTFTRSASVFEPMEVWWEPGTAGEQLLGTFSASENSGSITIPADAANGDHWIGLIFDFELLQCANFTVVESAVGQDAYPVVGTTVLPSTGTMALLPLAGMAAAGAGVLITRKRGRRVIKD